MQQPVLLSPKFEAKSSHILTQSQWSITVVYIIAGWILCEYSPWCKRKLWAWPWLCSPPVSPSFGLSKCGLSVYGSCFLPQALV
jgi:hypothetical protein